MSSSRTLSSSSSSAPDPSESLQSVLERCPSKNLKTPAAGKAVAIRPLKRVKKDAPTAAAAGAGTVMAEDPPALNLDDDNAPRGLLSPRKLDMDQEVVLAASALSPGGEEEEQEVIQPTQPQQIAADEEEEEEGELPPPAMERTMSVNFGPYVV